MQKSPSKSLVIVAVSAGALAFLFFGERTLADVFYFIAGTVGITAFFKQKGLRDEVKRFKERTSERVEEIEYRIEELEKKIQK